MLPDQIGDGFRTLRLQVSAKPQPLINSNGPHESVVRILIQGGRGNSETGIIYIGDQRKQEWQVSRGDNMPALPISRASAIFFRGDSTAVAAGDVLQVAIITTSGRRRQSTGP